MILLSCILLVLGVAYKLSVMSADTMHIYTVASDIFNYASLDGMSFPGNPFYFPDVVLALPIYAVVRDLYLFHAVFFAIEFIILFTIIIYGLKFDWRSSLLLCTFWISEMIKFYFDSYFYPNHHFGALLVVVYAIIYLSRQRHTYFLPIVLFAAVYSDAFLVPWLLVPLCLFAIYLLFVKSIREAAYVSLCIVAGALGHLLHTREFSLLGEAHPELLQKPVVARTLSDFNHNFALVVESLKYLLGKNAPLILILAGLVLLAFKAFYYRRQNNFQGRLAFLFLCSALSTLVFIFSTTVFVDSSNLRYAIPFIWLPIIYFFYCYSKFPKLLQRLVVVVLIFTQVGVLKAYVQDRLPAMNAVEEKFICVENFINTHNIEFAVGDYWNAKIYQFTMNVPMAPLDPSLNYFALASNRKWYIDAVQARPLRLVIANDLKKEKIETTFGKPSLVHNCAETELWLYPEGVANKDFSLRLVHQMRTL